MSIVIQTKINAIMLRDGETDEPFVPWKLYQGKVRDFLNEEFPRPFPPTVVLTEEQAKRLMIRLRSKDGQ